jgi:hypothetical protein
MAKLGSHRAALPRPGGSTRRLRLEEWPTKMRSGPPRVMRTPALRGKGMLGGLLPSLAAISEPKQAPPCGPSATINLTGQTFGRWTAS